jgi:hypothetical protein
VISNIFAEVASKEIIEAAIAAVDKEEVVDWAPAGHRVQPPEDEGDSSSADDTNELHARMLERITVLEEALENLSRPGIGHNQPPEPLEDEPLTDAELQALLGSISLLKSQPADPSDKRSEVIEAANVLETCFGAYLFHEKSPLLSTLRFSCVYLDFRNTPTAERNFHR